jgi:hypothetical protein
MSPDSGSQALDSLTYINRLAVIVVEQIDAMLAVAYLPPIVTRCIQGSRYPGIQGYDLGRWSGVTHGS